jgi:uncharacterized SAM-binding protein YcdF (DUF218 family)
MFFILSKVLAFLAMPLSLIFISLAISLFVKKQKIKLLFKRIAFSLLVFFTNPLLISLIMSWWEVPPTPYIEIKQKYEVGIVLGGMLSPESLPKDRLHFNASVDRINHAIELYKLGAIKKIMVSGGSGMIINQSNKEAPMLKKYAESFGVSAEDIIVESESRNTHENAVFSLALLENMYPENTKYLLITSAFHMRRSIGCFEKINPNYIAFTTGYISRPRTFTPDEWLIPSIDALHWWTKLAKEWIGYIAYSAVGYI